MKHRAFTLIELLVVVAIIGILAAVGVTTFGGFQEKAKVAAVKDMHGQVIKFVSTELMKCSLGLELKLKTDPNRYSNDLCSDYSKQLYQQETLQVLLITLLGTSEMVKGGEMFMMTQ